MPVKAEKHHITFFRQTGWMMMASTASGLLMYLVHPVATGRITGRGMPESEYGLFGALLQVVTMMTIPAGGLQPVMAQQQASAITAEQQRTIASEFRGVSQAMFFIWLAICAVTLVFWKQALVALKIHNPMALVMTLLIGLFSLWMPLVQGLLLGRQNFLWLGWMYIFNGVGRLAAVCMIVLIFQGWAAGAMGAVLAGMGVLVVTGLWQVRDVWKIERIRVQWGDWLRRVIPLTLGVGAGNFMLSADMPFTQRYFAHDTGYYVAAGMIGRALVFLTQPLVMVMFPKLARAKATGEKSNALALTLGTTAFFCGCAALAATILPWLPLRVMYPPDYVKAAAPLIPWFAWCMLPLTLSQVMINSLMAHLRFAAVPWLVFVAVSYGFALSIVGRHCGGAVDTMAGFRSMIQTIGVFNLLMFGVCALFTWGIPGKARGANA